jgi:hypothetical protein
VLPNPEFDLNAQGTTVFPSTANPTGIVSTANATAITIDSSENVGIGTSTPSHPLTVEGDGARIAICNTSTYPFLAGFSGFRSGTSHGNLYIETAGGGDFSTPVERIAIEGTTGEVKIATGDLFFGTAGKGIVLGSTTNVDANTLDDYEEGSFTPTFSSSGANFGSPAPTLKGIYTKIGRLVTFHIAIDTNAYITGTTSNAIKITGLPFVPETTDVGGQYGAHFEGYESWINYPNGVSGSIRFVIWGSNTELLMYQIRDNTGPTDIAASAFGYDDVRCNIAGHYNV